MKQPTRPWVTKLEDIGKRIDNSSESHNSIFDQLHPHMPNGNRSEWLRALAPILKFSALGLIADIYTTLAAAKLDQLSSTSNRKSQSYKPIYTMWDEEIPSPNPLTSLMWLLTCETWPLPGINDSTQFPPTAFVLPQSPSRQAWSRRPSSYHSDSLPLNPEFCIDQAINISMMSAMTTRDRANMIRFDELQTSTRLHLPQIRQWTCIGALENKLTGGDPLTRWNSIWKDASGWPRAGQFDLVEGFAYEIPPNNEKRLDQLYDLRHRVFLAAGILSHPGIPTCPDALHLTPGGWIRHWSQQCLFVSASERLHWTQTREPITWNDKICEMIPTFAPPIYFGWTEFGPRFEVTPEGKPIRTETASEQWANAYLKHRPLALRMLFEPESININDLVESHTNKRAITLERAGRLKTKSNARNVTLANAFQGALKGFNFNFAPSVESEKEK